MGVVCRFMTHPPTLCASCMGQGEIVKGRNARGGEVASDGGSSCQTALARPLPIWAASLSVVMGREAGDPGEGLAERPQDP